jgi:hypothetical protein
LTIGEESADPAAALVAAASLLDEGPGPARSRTVVRLLRYALEGALDAYWAAARPGEVPVTVPRGRRLRLLAATLGREFAHDTYTTWCRLSDAARPAPYEPAPHVTELRELQRRTETAVEGLLGGAVTTWPATGASSTSCT